MRSNLVKLSDATQNESMSDPQGSELPSRSLSFGDDNVQVVDPPVAVISFRRESSNGDDKRRRTVRKVILILFFIILVILALVLSFTDKKSVSRSSLQDTISQLPTENPTQAPVSLPGTTQQQPHENDASDIFSSEVQVELLTDIPSTSPSLSSNTPTGTPTAAATTNSPSHFPSLSPTRIPTIFPSMLPSFNPTPEKSKTLSPTPAPSCPVRTSRMPPLPGKKGVCMTLRPEGRNGSWLVNFPRVQSLNGHWNYRWGLERIAVQDSEPSMEFVPMQWGGARKPNERIWEDLGNLVVPEIEVGNVQRFLGFNEPDKENQANMTVSRAIELWPMLEALNLPLVSPSCAKPNGPWMEEFMARAEEQCLQIDWVGVHWYGGINAKNFKQDMLHLYNKFGRPLLITEFAPTDRQARTPAENRHTEQKILSFAQTVIPWLEAKSWIAGYAWFPFDQEFAHGTSSALFNTDGQLTSLGRYYASVTNQNPQGDLSIRAD